jgi:hypothetical protein
MRQLRINSMIRRCEYLGWLVIVISLISVPIAHAELSSARAEYLYGPETSKNEACNLALGKAKLKALANILGESVSAEELLSCKGSTGKISDYRCDLNQVTWSQIEGDIKKISNSEPVIEERGGATACVVDVEIEVIIPKEKPDPNFWLKADFKQINVRVGDDLNLGLELSQAGYFAVFNWLPHDSDSVVRIIPENEDTSQSNVYLSPEKSKGLKASFAMTASWAESYTGKRKSYDEYLIIVATKTPYRWFSKYSLDDFKSRLQSIPITEKRIVKKAYQLTKN